MKKIVFTLTVFALNVFSLSAHAAADEYIACKTETTKMVPHGGCIAVYHQEGKVCSDKAGTICSTTNLKDLCIATGKKYNKKFAYYASGLGRFNTSAACIDQCRRDYGGKMKNFGGECYDLVGEK